MHFFTVPIHESHQKYFKFEWIDKVYKFLGMSNGYSDAMRIFKKILKPVYANLRQKGNLSVLFVDDSYLQEDTEAECLENGEATIALLEYVYRFHYSWNKIYLKANTTNWVFGFHNWLNWQSQLAKRWWLLSQRKSRS